MEVQHKESDGAGQFYVQADGDILARMTYAQPNDKTMIIDHTEVDAALRHQKVGYKMVASAVQHARNNGLKIVPECPFVKSVFDKKQEYHDVLQQAN